MSFGAPGGRAINIKPIPYVHMFVSAVRSGDTNIQLRPTKYRPERGSFPLDHDAECKHIISSYLKCLKKARPSPDSPRVQAGVNDEKCRLIAKDYLQCRMDKNLMAKDDMKNLGLDFPSQFKGQRAEEAESAEMPQETR